MSNILMWLGGGPALLHPLRPSFGKDGTDLARNTPPSNFGGWGEPPPAAHWDFPPGTAGLTLRWSPAFHFRTLCGDSACHWDAVEPNFCGSWNRASGRR